MPIYEYSCLCCLHHFEVKQGFEDEPVTKCPSCHGEVRRIIRPSPVIFKGSGFYVTDNRKHSSTLDEPKSTLEEPKKTKEEPKAEKEAVKEK